MMYSKTVDANDYNVSIDGYSLIMEEVTINEAYNRRETVRHNVLGGTQTVMRGNYLVRDYSFTTNLLIDPKYPDVYDDMIKLWQSKSCEVISKFMGGKFDAEVIVKKDFENLPNYLKLEIQVIEIPSNESLIPNDKVLIQSEVKNSVKITSTNGKLNDKKNEKDNKGKGNNITKTK